MRKLCYDFRVIELQGFFLIRYVSALLGGSAYNPRGLWLLGCIQTPEPQSQTRGGSSTGWPTEPSPGPVLQGLGLWVLALGLRAQGCQGLGLRAQRFLAGLGFRVWGVKNC